MSRESVCESSMCVCVAVVCEVSPRNQNGMMCVCARRCARVLEREHQRQVAVDCRFLAVWQTASEHRPGRTGRSKYINAVNI
jgi:hypothetical protein